MIEHFQVSKDTIRRDFSILSERRLVQRTHGGIIPLDTSRQIPSFNDRISQLNQEKRLLPRRLWLSQAGADCFLWCLNHRSPSGPAHQGAYDNLLPFSDNAIMLSSQDKVDFHLLRWKILSLKPILLRAQWSRAAGANFFWHCLYRSS